MLLGLDALHTLSSSPQRRQKREQKRLATYGFRRGSRRPCACLQRPAGSGPGRLSLASKSAASNGMLGTSTGTGSQAPWHSWHADPKHRGLQRCNSGKQTGAEQTGTATEIIISLALSLASVSPEGLRTLRSSTSLDHCFTRVTWACSSSCWSRHAMQMLPQVS